MAKARTTLKTLCGVSAAALAAAAPALAKDVRTGVPNDQAAAPIGADIIVTAQRREESVQDVPIAVSAFGEKALEAQRLDGGSELVRAVPNVTFAKGYFSGFNFQIRGVGTQLGTASGDAGVGIHLNNVPLTISRFFEDEFFDVERVEVLRGPQGTLYGRNATGGVVNVVTAKPVGRFEALASAEVGTRDSYKLRGMVNVPFAGDRAAFRLSGSYLKRGGFGINTETGNEVNDRELWSTRATLRVEPVDGFEIIGLWAHFEEDDARNRTGRLVCVRDEGPSSVGGVTVTNPIIRGYLSQGCADEPSDGPNANGTPNSLATIFGFFTQTFGLTNGDYNAGRRLSTNLNDTDSLVDPRYIANSDHFQLHLGLQITPSLKVSTLSSYLDDYLRSRRDFQGASGSIPFAATAFTPGGVFTDPQLGPLNRFLAVDDVRSDSTQYSQEVRLDSSFDGPFNFSLGAIYVNYKTRLDFFVFSNAFTLAARAFGLAVDPGVEPTPETGGHNYFLSRSPYELTSKAIFGEVYVDLSDRLKLTVGGRLTHDRKEQENLPVRLLTPGTGLARGTPRRIIVVNKEPTGRVALDWKPELSFTDETLIYAVATRGYKAGGPNPPASFGQRDPYKPEFVNAIELGTKNTLANGRVTLNLTGFYYDYKDYQVTEIRNRTQEIQNIDAKSMGLELEAVVEPVDGLRLNAAIGYLDTEITKGAFVDLTNFTGNDPTLTLVKATAGSNCAVNTAALAAYLATNPSPAAFVSSVCAGLVPGLVPNRDGVLTSIKGNELPNAPHWTLSLGGQYSMTLGDAWQATLRGDYYRQSSSFARTYNSPADGLKAWDNLNLTLTIENNDLGLQVQGFVKNVFNTQPLLNTFLADQITGFARFGFTSDPRIIGVNVTKRF